MGGGEVSGVVVVSGVVAAAARHPSSGGGEVWGVAAAAARHPSSALKVVSVKFFWSFSLAKLMQSCSSELVSKISKPKMSSTPMNFLLSSSWSSLPTYRGSSGAV